MKEVTKYQKKFRLKAGEEVIITTGKCKGLTGKIEKLDLKKDRVFVANQNIAKRHTKPSSLNPQGGIVDKGMSLHISNVALLDPKEKKATKVGFKFENGKKVRFAKLSGVVLS